MTAVGLLWLAAKLHKPGIDLDWTFLQWLSQEKDSGEMGELNFNLFSFILLHTDK